MRRRALLGALALGGCSSGMADLAGTATTPDARALLAAADAAMGGPALAGMPDVSVSYAGEWNMVVDRLQPELVDAGFRGGSQERLLLRAGVVGQAHAGPSGRKQVVRRMAAGGPGQVQAWFNGAEATGPERRDRDRRDAAALVVDAYMVFLLGPLALSRVWAGQRGMVMELAGTEVVRVAGTYHDCDVLRVRMTPGIGLSPADDLALLVDRRERLMRQVRLSLNGLEGTRGAVAEVDASGHVEHQGVRWPTRFAERLLRPLPLHIHDWRLTGLDVGRGLQPAEVSGTAFTGRAVAPAAAWG